MQGSAAGYGESSVYGQSGYGEYGQQAAASAGQKRANPYQVKSQKYCSRRVAGTRHLQTSYDAPIVEGNVIIR